MLKKIAVIILTYNSDKIIKRTIKAAKKPTRKPAKNNIPLFKLI